MPRTHERLPGDVLAGAPRLLPERVVADQVVADRVVAVDNEETLSPVDGPGAPEDGTAS